MSFAARLALAVGLVLFVGGMAAAVWRATRRLLLPRVVLTALAAVAILAVAGVSSLLTLAMALVGIVAIAALEQRTGSSTGDS